MIYRAIAFFVVPSIAAAQPNAKVKAAAEGIVAADLMRDASYLASDALRGRGTPSAGLDSAQQYVIRELTRLKLQPAGDGGTYRQHYTVVQVALDTARTTASIGGRALAYGDDFLVRSLPDTGTLTGAVVNVGAGIRAPKRGLDPYANVDVRGKWLLVQGGLPAGLTREQLGARWADYTTVDDEARARGALGVITVLPEAMRANWSTMRSRVPASRELSPSVGRAYAQSPLPQLVLAPGALTTVSGTDAPLRVTLAGTRSAFQASNVVALVPGSDPMRRDEWITSSSHLDGAVGRGTSASGDSIYNAADDNASGSAGNLAIARALLRAPRAKRSVLLIWDSGEETGLWGSRFLAYGPLADKVVAHVTVDMIARTRKPGTSVPGEEELSGPDTVFAAGPKAISTELGAVLDRVQRDYGWLAFDRRFDDPTHEFFYPRTDAAPYLERGIPYVEIFTGLHGDYHRQSDEVAKFDPAKFQATARTIFTTIWTLADDPARPRIDKPLPPAISFVVPR